MSDSAEVMDTPDWFPFKPSSSASAKNASAANPGDDHAVNSADSDQVDADQAEMEDYAEDSDCAEGEQDAEHEGQADANSGPAADTKPKLDLIVMKGGELVPIAIQAEQALIKSGANIFQREAHLVQPVKYGAIRTDEQLAAAHGDTGQIHRDRNATVLRVIDKPNLLIGEMSTAAIWCRRKMIPAKPATKTRPAIKAELKLILADPEIKYVNEVLARAGKWSFRVLRGVIAAPTLDRNGGIIETPGYDSSSGLLLDFKAGEFPPIPQHPTKDEALAALAKLNRPLRGFPFEGETPDNKKSASRSVALSALLCAVIRPSLRIVPLHGFNAPESGTGKSILAKTAGMLATGTMPVAMSQGKTPEEDEKRLSVVLHEGDNVVFIDNCEKPLTGDFLCSMLTEEIVQARILGQSERRLLPCLALVVASGNNLIYATDIIRRSLDCRLNANMERPDEREFDFNVLDEIRAQRPELVVAALTILRAYKLAKPNTKLKAMGDFTDYEWVRGALVWLGQNDPLETQKDLAAFDPVKDSLLKVLECWDRTFGQRRIKLSELNVEKEATKELRDILIEEACRNEGWKSKSVGWWLRRNRDRHVGGLCLKRFGDDKTAEWAVLGGNGPSASPSPSPAEPSKPTDPTITLTLYRRRETEKAVLFVKKGSVEVWLPKCLLKLEPASLDDDARVAVTIPAWLARENGLSSGDDYDVKDPPF